MPHRDKTSGCIYIGNDIVDIGSDENLRKADNARLCQRVLTENERYALKSAFKKSKRQQQLTFLALWAAKEATYKLLKKIDDTLLFAHAKFEVSGVEQIVHKRKTLGSVIHNSNEKVNVCWEISDSWLHCTALLPDSPPEFITRIAIIDEALIAGDFSHQEMISIYSEPSKAVRNLAKALLCEQGLGHTEIIRHEEQRRYSPPWIYVAGERIKHLDISLSHDGKFMAAVLAGI